jgi:hypothetical protein
MATILTRGSRGRRSSVADLAANSENCMRVCRLACVYNE